MQPGSVRDMAEDRDYAGDVSDFYYIHPTTEEIAKTCPGIHYEDPVSYSTVSFFADEYDAGRTSYEEADFVSDLYSNQDAAVWVSDGWQDYFNLLDALPDYPIGVFGPQYWYKTCVYINCVGDVGYSTTDHYHTQSWYIAHSGSKYYWEDWDDTLRNLNETDTIGNPPPCDGSQ